MELFGVMRMYMHGVRTATTVKKNFEVRIDA